MGRIIPTERHIPSAAFFLAVLAIAFTYWIASLMISPGTSLDEAILFRPHGDSDYLPIVSALSRLEFGETSVWETAHQGLRSFPMAPLIMHGIMVRFAGDIGFVVADVLVFLFYGLALVYFLRSAEISARLAEVLAVMVLGGVANQFVLTSARMGADIPLTFWQSRFPRPGVTEVFVLAFFILAIRLIGRRGAATGVRDWLLVGVVWACLLQADIYQAANLTLVALLFAGYLLIVDTRRALRGIGAAACAAVICALPFVYQRLHEL
ncbi:MAG: hypothetical protein LAQ69_52155, partial [Acidobacteriia bacterium]|nr:hypothetical protein [Terriglobia bacterium]